VEREAWAECKNLANRENSSTRRVAAIKVRYENYNPQYERNPFTGVRSCSFRASAYCQFEISELRPNVPPPSQPQPMKCVTYYSAVCGFSQVFYPPGSPCTCPDGITPGRLAPP